MVYLGVSYSMGVSKLGKAIGVEETEARSIIQEFNSNVPYLNLLSRDCMATASARGYIKTLLGRRRRFNAWECRNKKEAGIVQGSIEDAKEAFGTDNEDVVQRAYTYKAFNSLIQGSSADIMKKAMVDVWKSGVCEVLGPPLLTVHDELDFSVPNTKEGKEAIQKVKEIMENTIKLNVPLEVDMEVGPNWGEVE